MRNRNFADTILKASVRQSWSVSKSAAKEYLTDMYLLTSDGLESAYEDSSDFIDNFFSCRALIPAEYFDDGNFIIEAKASADLIKRPAPLSLLDPFLRAEISETGWVHLGD